MLRELTHLIIHIAVWSAIIFAIISVGGFSLLWFTTREEVKNKRAPEPMEFCEKHGPYPRESALTMRVQEVGGGEVLFCPYCMADRVKKRLAK
jgi:hypothetical protein